MSLGDGTGGRGPGRARLWLVASTPSPTPPSENAAARFRELLLPHADAAHNLARRMTRDPHAAEDVVHDAYVRALARIDGLRGGDGRAWLLAIVRNGALDHLRARAREAGRLTDDVLEEIKDDRELTPEAALALKDEAVRLRALVDRLPLKLREVVVLREMEELGYREIAQVIDAPIGSVMSRLARAREALGAAWRELEARDADGCR